MKADGVFAQEAALSGGVVPRSIVVEAILVILATGELEGVVEVALGGGFAEVLVAVTLNDPPRLIHQSHHGVPKVP